MRQNESKQRKRDSWWFSTIKKKKKMINSRKLTKNIWMEMKRFFSYFRLTWNHNMKSIFAFISAKTLSWFYFDTHMWLSLYVHVVPLLHFSFLLNNFILLIFFFTYFEFREYNSSAFTSLIFVCVHEKQNPFFSSLYKTQTKYSAFCVCFVVFYFSCVCVCISFGNLKFAS